MDGHAVALGNAAMMQALGIPSGEHGAEARALEEAGRTAMFAAVDGALSGVIAVADEVRETAPDAIGTLREAGLRIVMATGDSPRTAAIVARTLGIDEVHAGLVPEEKAALVDDLRRRGLTVAMAGDGRERRARAGVRRRRHRARQRAPTSPWRARASRWSRATCAASCGRAGLARATVRNVRQNLFLAFVYNGAAIPIAAGVLFPPFGILLSPMIAAAAMSLSSVSVIANALRLRAIRV